MTTQNDLMRAMGAVVDEEWDETLPVPPEHDHDEDDNPPDEPRMRLIVAQRLAVDEWGARWPDCSASQNARAAGGGVAVNIHKDLAALTAGLLAATREVHGYVLHQDQTGGFVCRPIGGTRTASNHSISTALDINWRENEFSYSPRYTLPRSVIDMWRMNGWSWGGDWSGKKDTMHFEWVRSREVARQYTERFYQTVEELSTEQDALLRQINENLHASIRAFN